MVMTKWATQHVTHQENKKHHAHTTITRQPYLTIESKKIWKKYYAKNSVRNDAQRLMNFYPFSQNFSTKGIP